MRDIFHDFTTVHCKNNLTGIDVKVHLVAASWNAVS